MSGLWRRNCLYNVQVAGLALHALEPDEEIDVLEHIPGCPSCQAALTDAERVLAQLGGAVEQVQPPVTLRGSILAEAAETVQVPSRPQRVERVPAAEPGVTVPAQHRATSGRRRAADRRPARPGSSRRSRLVAATLALVGIVAIGGLAVRSAPRRAERDAETAQAQTLADIVTGLDEPGTRFATLAAPDGRVLAAVVVRDGRRTLVTSDELAPNAAGDIYVLWG
ncbi:MAG: hypothetical protein ACT4RN_06145, partial [Pseudonocardia sp.]